MKIKAKILAEDIRNTNYFSIKDCAITRALNRAGYENWKDCGLVIKNGEGMEVVNESNEQYSRLSNKVIAMYGLKQMREDREGYLREPIEAEDFEFEIEV